MVCVRLVPTFVPELEKNLEHLVGTNVQHIRYYTTHHGGVVAQFNFDEMTLFLDGINQRVCIGNIPSGVTEHLEFCSCPCCLQDTVG